MWISNGVGLGPVEVVVLNTRRINVWFVGTTEESEEVSPQRTLLGRGQFSLTFQTFVDKVGLNSPLSGQLLTEPAMFLLFHVTLASLSHPLCLILSALSQ